MKPIKGVTMKKYVPLEQVIKPNLTTEEAAFYLDRAVQTLRGWACLGIGPIKPIHIGGRLAWRVRDLKKVLGVDAPA